MEAINVFSPYFRVDECLIELRECLEKGWTGLGFKTVQFENAWRDYTELSHAHFLNSATSGLHLAVKMFKQAYGWAEDSEIITSPLTFVSTNHAILYEGLKPVFCDVDEYLCLCPENLIQRITEKTKAVIFVGMGGNAGQYDRVQDICRKNNLIFILDAAHMAGTRLHGKHIGHDADVSVFSFQAVKNLPTADSGMICFNKKEFDDDVRKWSWLGINKDTFARTEEKGSYKWDYDVEHVGYKYHGNSMMAALGLVGLKYLDQDNAYRRQLAKWYEERLAAVKLISTIGVASGCESSRHTFQITLKNRDEAMLALNSNGIYPGVHYKINSAYRMYQDCAGHCPNAERYSSEIITLPIHLRLSYADIKRVCDTLDEFIQHSEPKSQGS